MNGVVSAGLLAALRWLDEICGRAVAAAQAIYAAPGDPYRGLYISDADVASLFEREPGVPIFGTVDGLPLEELPPFDDLARLFSLSDFDVKVLLVACGTTLDTRYERLYAYLQDDVTRKQPTVDLALNLLCSTLGEKLSRRRHFTPGAPLLRHGLLTLTPDPNAVESSTLSHFLVPSPDVVSFILGLDAANPRDVREPEIRLADLPLADDLKHALSRLVVQSVQTGQPLRLYFEGQPGTGRRQAADAVAYELGRSLLVVEDAAEIPGLASYFRQAALTSSLLYVAGTPRDPAEFARLLAEHAGGVIASGAAPLPGMVALTFARPDFEQRRAAWILALEAEASSLLPADLDRLAALKLSSAQIRQAVRQAADRAMWASSAPTVEDYFAAAGILSGGELAALAQKIHPLYGWDDIVLPDDVRTQLVELCGRVEGGHRVMDEWGFRHKLSQGRGITALFAGPSGTGKTMASEIIARHLHLELYRIDLAGVVSKYIGETEKNLDRIFAAAEGSNAILLFDEADALFGKRSEVRDAHDRYANLEISYLLQKMEQFDGVAILTTNLRGNLDDAFTRRLAFTVYFPFPDADDRSRIWSGIWPEAAPLADDADLDLLARRFKLSGGSIRNVALAAAFFAASEGGVIHMEHLLRAIQREYGKMGKLLTEAELAGGIS